MNDVQFTRSAPYLPVASVAATADYYERILGFTREYIAGEPPQFAIVSRDGLPIMLRLVEDPHKIVPSEGQGGTWDVFFWVRDVDALFRELEANGAQIVYRPIVQPYSVLEFAARDRDGHVLGFGQQVPSPSNTAAR